MDVRGILDDWPERAERQLHGFTLTDAAGLVEEPGLKAVLKMK